MLLKFWGFFPQRDFQMSCNISGLRTTGIFTLLFHLEVHLRFPSPSCGWTVSTAKHRSVQNHCLETDHTAQRSTACSSQNTVWGFHGRSHWGCRLSYWACCVGGCTSADTQVSRTLCTPKHFGSQQKKLCKYWRMSWLEHSCRGSPQHTGDDEVPTLRIHMNVGMISKDESPFLGKTEPVE